MEITINGKSHTITDGTALHGLITQLVKKPECVIAELNGAIVERTRWQDCGLKAGDTLELVSFVGGG